MTIFEIAAALLVLSAVFGFLNHHLLKLPHAVGMVVIALGASLTLIVLDILFPSLTVAEIVTEELARIDFEQALMDGMLSFLLFAGALHIDFHALASRKWVVLALATAGTLASTLMVGFAMWLGLGLIGLDVPLTYTLVFGALISPTDPVAVLGILKTVKVPASLEAKIAGESLFNDGVGVVVFTVMVAIAAGGTEFGALDIVEMLAVEVLGGAALGLAAGWLCYLAMRQLDEFNLEVLISLALVMGAYAVAHALHISGPIAVVVAGLLIGNQGVKFAMSEVTRDYLKKFWVLLDEILNSVLFLLIGLEVMIVSFTGDYLIEALIAIPIVLLARLIAVSVPIRLFTLRETFEAGVIPVLTWGGLRGGISVALALSLPASEYKPAILAITYVVVVFSIIVQGLTVKPLVSRFHPAGR